MVIFKYVVLACFVVLAGCAGTQKFDGDIAQESMLMKTENHAGLIEFYKAKLKEKEDVSNREKLAQAYLDYGDPDSALFTISPLTKRVTDKEAVKKKSDSSTWKNLVDGEPVWTSWANKKVHLNWLLIQANSETALGKREAALSSALQAFQLDKKNAEVANLIGVIYAAGGNIYEARHYFYIARENLYDDLKVKNNLALLFILEGKYDRAVDMLLPLYANGQADQQVESNLIIAMVKKNDLDLMRRVLKPKYSDREIAQKYQALKPVKPASWVKAFNGALRETN
ncbi:tetratricopeptide repeat protein [Vibrio lentus]|uniref:Secretion protein n=1 Tax=Vibrio lentus TaxID=136468 RepID=A0AB36XH37_9VIBR|nr:hypothetical protein [Vibrio lentus]MCC4839894.1 hypothetical protein [Vibrio lentus]PMI13252.1 hypothetical protein BCU51_22720 [Vibrio lentus]PMK37650.1 hypothetical protein BCU02_08890 [Vibrio lentus]PMK41947.1 hypothetical protein BCT99_06995 [Vibrio lentus]PML34272.1 hypothetical protein BCT79_10310 [Vibrio lentus]